jgi:hypothetical protein
MLFSKFIDRTSSHSVYLIEIPFKLRNILGDRSADSCWKVGIELNTKDCGSVVSQNFFGHPVIIAVNINT